MGRKVKIWVGGLKADTLKGLSEVKAYLGELELEALEELIRRVEKLLVPTPTHCLNSEQKALVHRDLNYLYSRHLMIKQRRMTALNLIGHYKSKERRLHEPG